MNNRAYYDLSNIIALFGVFIIVGVGIAAGTWMFYSTSADIRLEESKIMADKLISGLVSEGYLKKGVLNEDFNIYKETGISKSVINKNEYFFKVEILKNGESIRPFFIDGKRDFEVYCDSKSGKESLKCYFERLVVLDEVNERVEIKILCASNELGKKL